MNDARRRAPGERTRPPTGLTAILPAPLNVFSMLGPRLVPCSMGRLDWFITGCTWYINASKSGLNEDPFDALCDQMQWKSDRDPRATLGQKIQEVSAEKNVRGEMARHGDLGAV